MTDDARYVLTASAGAAAKIGHAELVERIRELLEQLQADGSDEA